MPLPLAHINDLDTKRVRTGTTCMRHDGKDFGRSSTPRLGGHPAGGLAVAARALDIDALNAAGAA